MDLAGLLDRFALRRRVVVAALTAIAVLAALHTLRPTPPATRAVWVAARDLSGGAPLAAGDVRSARLPVADVPSRAVESSQPVTGRTLAAPMRAGEPLTDVRLLSPALLAATGVDGAVAVPVRVADGPAALALVHAGDLVDVIAVGDPASGVTGAASAVVHDVRVLATPARETSPDAEADGAGLLIVAATPRQAAALATASAGSRLSVAVRRQ
jgi:pilus assembly protein CpaB